MKLLRRDHPSTLLSAKALSDRPGLVTLILAMFLATTPLARSQQASTDPSTVGAPLSAEEVVQNLVEMNQRRLQALDGYEGTRTYKVQYRGFPSDRNAEMVVNVKYQSPGTKEFTIESSTGSKLIVDRVFKKLLEAEKEALQPEAQKRSALNSDNYEFKLVGYESTSDASMYVLSVEPRTKEKFLYRGKIWVDAKDFAVVRLKAEPAKNPSFWTKKSEIEQQYKKVNDFWLPAMNRSVSSIRLGGRAELTIEYKDYQVTAVHPVTSQSSTTPNSPSLLRIGDQR